MKDLFFQMSPNLSTNPILKALSTFKSIHSEPLQTVVCVIGNEMRRNYIRLCRVCSDEPSESIQSEVTQFSGVHSRCIVAFYDALNCDDETASFHEERLREEAVSNLMERK